MAGKGLGDLMSFFFASILPEEQLNTAATFEDFIKGLVWGLDGTQDISALKSCIKEEGTILTDIKTGLETTEPLEADAIMKGLKVVFSALL